MDNVREFSKGKFLAVLSLLSLCALGTMSGCGKSGDVKNLLGQVQAQVFTQTDGNLVASVSAALNTGNYSMASFSVPIADPHHPDIQYGTISLRPSITGAGGVLTISVNVSEAAHLPTSAVATLPNGTAFPLAIPSGETVVEIPIGAKGAELYLLSSNQTLMIGTAIPFSALNGVGQYVPGINVFAPVATGNINSFIGIFAGSQAGQTGLGLFIDLSSILPKPQAQQTLAIGGGGGNARVATQVMALRSVTPASTQATKITLNAPNYSSRAEQKLYYKLWETGENNPVLRFQ